jgi:ankyrin repeat protein
MKRSRARSRFAIGGLCAVFFTAMLPDLSVAAEPEVSRIPSAEDPALAQAKRAVRLRDFDKAVSLWRGAAERGNARAQYRLGSAYRSGRGIDRDLSKAAFWFEKAANGGEPDAQYALGMLYQKGHGVAQNRDQAMSLLGLAARRGHREAKAALDEIQRSGSIAFATADARVGANQNDPREALAQSIRFGDVGAAREALARGAPVNGAPGDEKHWRPLILAIESNRPEIVGLLFEHGADPNRKSRLGEPALILAVRAKNRDIVRKLLAAGGRSDAKSIGGFTPLMEAARAGASGIASDLISAGASSRTTLADGLSAADIARRFQFDELARRLARAGAPVQRAREDAGRLAALDSSRSASTGASSTTLPPIIEAARRGDVELLREMIARGRNLEIRDPEGESALHRAAEGGHVEAARALLEAGLEPDLEGREAATPLLRATASRAEGSEAVIALLLEAGADPHRRDEFSAGVIDYAAEGATVGKLERLRAAGGSWSEGDAGRSLARAAKAGRLTTLSALLGVTNGTKSRNLAVCAAIGADQSEALGLLLQERLAFGQDCDEGRSALMIAAHRGRDDFVATLLVAGAEPDGAARNGDTALIAASSRGHSEIVARLLRAEADVDRRGAHQMTALMAGASNGHREVVRLLLEARADRRMRGESDQTALDLARSAGHDDVADQIASFKPGWGSIFGSRAE